MTHMPLNDDVEPSLEGLSACQLDEEGRLSGAVLNVDDRNYVGSVQENSGSEERVSDSISQVGREHGRAPESAEDMPPGDTVAQIRTRVGRTIKPVTRLIQIMNVVLLDL